MTTSDLRQRLVDANLASMNVTYTDEELAGKAVAVVVKWLHEQADAFSRLRYRAETATLRTLLLTQEQTVRDLARAIESDLTETEASDGTR